MTRYAIYARPGVQGDADAAEAVALAEAAERWLTRPDMQGLTVDARRYGFHATLVSPFHLADGTTAEELHEAADAFAAGRGPVAVPAPRPVALGKYRALRPHGDETKLGALAADAVRAFDEFRAPPTELEIKRRRPERMTPRERELFERWGYPYVFDQFHFHLTLTDRVPKSQAAEVDLALTEHFADVAGVDVPLRAITIFTESEPGAPFELRSIHPFRRTVSPVTAIPNTTTENTASDRAATGNTPSDHTPNHHTASHNTAQETR